jgi:uncharacterized protein (DUF736 family)
MSNYDNTNKGALFTNDQKGNEKAPNYKGKLNVNGKEYEIAGWVRQGKSGSFLSLTVSEPFQKSTLTDAHKQTTYTKPKETGDLPF